MKMEDLKTIFSTCKTFVSKDSIRPILQTIQLNFQNGFCTAYALDGIKMISVIVPYIDGDEGTLYVPIIKLPKGAYVVISDEGNEITFDFLESKQTVKKYEGEFPKDPAKLFDDKEPTFNIGVDPKNLRDALDGFKDTEAVSIDFYGQLNPFVVKGLTKKALVLPVKLKDRG